MYSKSFTHQSTASPKLSKQGLKREHVVLTLKQKMEILKDWRRKKIM
jgi:hypothetical protein